MAKYCRMTICNNKGLVRLVRHFFRSLLVPFPTIANKRIRPYFGVIKGSEQTLKCGEGFLDKDAYYSLSHRSQATFSNQRDAIYKLFQAYLKRKRERGDYDAADRTHAILDGLRVQGVPGKEVDFIYVDEAQDNLLIDALVLRSICRNPNGLFWAGDTAQTISVGSAFRFNDLKAFLYRVEEANAGPHAESQTQPQSFQLTVNYRSHAGIVSCAHSVVELITEFWPHAIDFLGEERGMIDGLKPVFFSGWDQNTVRYEQFLFGESGSHIEFGAQQCILVRDDAARVKLREQVGDIGLIMTLYESKGLEFNDVLLYNFFEDSTVDLSQWRVVLNALPERECGNHPAPRFDDTRHSGVCRELKFLYVAITRARKNLWIADCSEKGEPMRVFWTARNQLQNCTPGTDVPRLAMSSSAEDWAKTALSLFNNRRYLQAMHCYERAGLPREKAVARAYYLREQARATPVIPRSDGIAQSTAFTIAAEAFLKSAEQAVKERRAYYRIAAECYVLSGDDRKAGQAYLSALEFTLSAQHFRKAGRFDEAVKVIKAHRSEMTHTVADSIVDVSRLYYLSKQKVKEARELFESDEDALEYMDDYGLDIARATLLEELGRFADAAELHLAEGHTLDAIRLFLADQQNSISVRRAYQCLLDGLWRHLSCGIMFHSDSAKANVTLQELLRLSAQLNHASSDENSDDEMSMFRAIASSDLARLLQLGEKFYLLHHNMAAAFLCMDHVFSTMPKLQAASLSQIATKLQTFLSYAQMLQKFVSDSDLCNNKTIRKLFGFEASTEELFLIPKETSLFTQINDRLTPTARSTDEGSIVVRWELERLIGFFLRGRLLRRVIQENEMCHTLRAFRPCLPFIIFRHCNRQECPRDHVDPAFYDANAYNNRVRVHLQQILIYQTLHAVENGAERDRQKRDWLRQLYDALFPPHYKMGSLHLLATAMIPEFQKGLQVVRTWVPELFYALDPYAAQHQFLSSLTRAAALSYTFDSYAAHHYIRRANCYSMYRPPHLLRSPDAYVVHDILAFMEDNHQNSLSRGILFMKHVLDNQIPIDIAVLCDFLDHLCGSLVISVRFQRDSTLHDVTLPRSWLVREVRAINKAKLRDTGLSFVYVKSMTALLEQIYTGLSADYLLFERRALSNLGFQIKNVFFARICRNLCLLGYNIRTWSLKNEIFRIITSVRKPNRQFNPLIESYVTARSWEYLARTVRSSVTGSPLDEMIQLHDATRMVRNMELPNVRRIVYKHLDEIPGLLNSGGLLLSKTVLRGEALPFVPTRPGSANVASGDQTNELLPVSADVSVDADPLFDDDEGNDDIIENTVNVDDIAQAIDAGQTNSAPAAPTEAEVAAANAIQVAYRQYLARRRTTTKTTLHEMRRRIFTAFQEASHTMQWPHKYYRFLYLGPLPHLLVCLECMQNHIHTAKNHARKRFMVVQHIELENAQAAFSVWAGLLKDVVRLQKLLGPKSEFHVGRDLVQLKARVVEVERLMHSVPSGPPLEWQEDMKIAVKGIVKTKQLPVKEVKPELNVEDVLEDY
ncbi:TPR and ankyrin repeat-containing protein 1 [Grifola frondosa]|uniref:TPR and ankyrin repeat-containing protein 1 n=1 Tax=Grifola frondosa TaxID=5627 RepID=A0A1C7MQG7_GRIFR|nr:TPR and ankyrin repeat-containing protein 1 [Grifola frondosa]